MTKRPRSEGNYQAPIEAFGHVWPSSKSLADAIGVSKYTMSHYRAVCNRIRAITESGKPLPEPPDPNTYKWKP